MKDPRELQAWLGSALAAEIRLYLTILVSTDETFDVNYLGEPCKLCGHEPS